jgi:hypothetical protein
MGQPISIKELNFEHTLAENEKYIDDEYGYGGYVVLRMISYHSSDKWTIKRKAFFLKQGVWTEGQTAYQDTFFTALAIVKRLYPEEQKKMTWELFHELYGCVKEWINRHHCSNSLCGVQIKTVKGVEKFCKKWIPTH